VLEFRQVLGTAYGAPDAGPLAAYHRILRGYLNGDWAGIPAAVRALELSSSPHTPVLHAGRLLAAEVYAALGDLERGAEWLARAGDHSPFPALHAWMAMGIASRANEWERARQVGWAAHEKIPEAGWVGISWLLSRQVLVEWRSGDHNNLPHLHAEVKRWHALVGGAGLRGVELTAQAGAEHDYAIALQAVEILRVHGNRGELMLACMIAAALADDPRPWYHEAYQVAKRVGSKVQGALIMASMRDSGVQPPRDLATPSALTGIELRIVDLVCEGLTNRQFAGRLRVSEKTVENNLTRLFAKTGCRSGVDLTLASMDGRLRLSGAR
jgi:DNA-binding NarL/FixJ family response regulator